MPGGCHPSIDFEATFQQIIPITASMRKAYYLILYAERDDRLVIERIVHGARDLDNLDQ
jgi:hypothetical protein